MLNHSKEPMPTLQFRAAHLDPVCARDKVATVRLAREVRHLRKGDALRLAFGKPDRSIFLAARCEAVVCPLNLSCLHRGRSFELTQDDYIGLEGFVGWLARLVSPLALVRFSLCSEPEHRKTHRPTRGRRRYASDASNDCGDMATDRTRRPVQAVQTHSRFIHDSRFSRFGETFTFLC